MNIALHIGEPRKKIPRVVEIIGPAGAGKTTIFNALSNYPERIRLANFPNVKRIADAPFFIQYGLQLVPILFRLYWHAGRKLSRREFAWMSILKGWSFVLDREVKKSSQVVVLDQGPVYLLAEMMEFGTKYQKSEYAEKFWQKIFNQWADTLNLIVWLDAEDNMLMKRIQTREKGHMVKLEPAPKVFDFLQRYRRAYDYVISMMEINPSGPRILRFDTGIQRSEEIINCLLGEFGLS